MSFTARHLKIIAPPVLVAVIVLAAPALARTVPRGRSATTTKCFTITVNRKRVRECLIPGPQGRPGVAGPQGAQGPRGFLGPRAATGKTGKQGSTGKTDRAGRAGGAGLALSLIHI